MKHFDLFSGYGGFTIACERNGIKTIGFSEIDKYANAVLEHHWPKIKNYGDITKIYWSEVPDFDLLTGGSPCQDLSIAGKRQGLAGERSGLFVQFVRALKEKQPEYFIWENVKGALSSNGGFDFAEVLNQMAEAGYSLQWQVLNAKDFGIPQNRERIFVVGTREGGGREVFLEREDAKSNILIEITKRSGGDGGVPSQRILNGKRIRRLTPRECERLMGLPDDWTKEGIQNGKLVSISDTQRYKLCGNGVVVNVVEEIIKAIIL